MILNVPDMSCGHCKAAVEKAIAGTDAAAAVVVDLPAHRVEVTTAAAPAAILAALDAAGYPATVAG